MDEKEYDASYIRIQSEACIIEEPGPIHNSYFLDQYQLVFKNIDRIIQESMELQKKRQKPYNCYSDVRIHNIISFIGERGSGKTSIMLTVNNWMRRFHFLKKEQKIKDIPFFSEENPKNLRFHCLDYIDGSLLEEGEDILQLVLAQMYVEFQKQSQYGFQEQPEYDQQKFAEDIPYRSRNDEYQRRELQNQFEQMSQTSAVFGHGKIQQEWMIHSSSLSSLRQMNDSLTLKKEFEKLVEKYLNVLYSESYSNHNNGNNFLVITIDDLDLNISHGFEMLENIHRYLMVPNVIILVSYDIDQLKRLCIRHFYQVTPHPTRDTVTNDYYLETERLAQDYLDKVMPLCNRIYIQSLIRRADVQVEMDLSGVKKAVNQKYALFFEYYRSLGVRMDTQGKKRHFLEQKSIRLFVSFILMLQRMEACSELFQDASFYPIVQNNFNIIIENLICRTADERLLSNQKTDFNIITKTQPVLPRAFRFFSSYIITERLTPGQQDDPQIQRNLAAMDYYGNSYGELLRNIYRLGRINSEYKELIRCLLEFYSLTMSQSYYAYRCYREKRKKLTWEMIHQEADQQEKTKKEIQKANQKEQRFKMELIETINGSFTGSWANRMVPMIEIKVPISEINQNNIPLFEIDHDSPNIRVMFGIRKNVNMYRVFRFTLEPDSKKITNGYLNADNLSGKEVLKYCYSFLVLGMFFDQPIYKHEKTLLWKILRLERSEKIADPKDPFKNKSDNIEIACAPDQTAVFNFMGFVSNAFVYTDNVEALLRSICQALFKDITKDHIQDAINKITKEFKDWKNYSGGFAIPLYHVDISYNIAKRLRQRRYGERIEYLRIENVLDYIKDTYRFVWKELAKNDTVYHQYIHLHPYNPKEPNYSGIHIRFADAFIHCPYIQWLFGTEGLKQLEREQDEPQEYQKSEYLLDDFPDMFQKMLHQLGYNSDAKEDDLNRSIITEGRDD